MLVLAAGLIALFAPTVTEQAKILAGLRSDIGLAEAAVRAERARGLAELRGLAQRKARLEAEVAAERRRLQRVRDDQARAEATIAARSAKASTLKAAVLAGVDTLTPHIAAALPYRIVERQNALADLSAQVAGDRLDPAEGAARLWRFAEDELRLTAEVVRLSLPVDLGQGPQLVEVVKLGMVTLLVRHPAGGFGRLVHSGDGWAYEAITDAQALEGVARFFDDLDRDIHGGVYPLPLAAPAQP